MARFGYPARFGSPLYTTSRKRHTSAMCDDKNKTSLSFLFFPKQNWETQKQHETKEVSPMWKQQMFATSCTSGRNCISRFLAVAVVHRIRIVHAPAPTAQELYPMKFHSLFSFLFLLFPVLSVRFTFIIGCFAWLFSRACGFPCFIVFLIVVWVFVFTD